MWYYPRFENISIYACPLTHVIRICKEKSVRLSSKLFTEEIYETGITGRFSFSDLLFSTLLRFSQDGITPLINDPINRLHSIHACAENKRYVQLYENGKQTHRFRNVREYNFFLSPSLSFFKKLYYSPVKKGKKNLVILYLAHRSWQF